MNRNLTAEAPAPAPLHEGINLVLSRWAALGMAVENKWGGRDSFQKSLQLGRDIFHLLTQSTNQVCIDDVVHMLDEFMLTSFNAEIGDGSVWETAKQVMVMHEERAASNFDSIRRLQETNAPNGQRRRNDGEDNDGDVDIDDDYQISGMNRNLTAEAAAQLHEGISLVLSRWAALRMAITSKWGGLDSIQKAQQLDLDIFHLLTQSRGQVHIDDVEHMLNEFMLIYFNAEIGDSSVRKTAKKVMLLHKECSEANFA